MALRDDAGSSLAPYPNPPSYLWKEFTQEKVAKIQSLRENGQLDANNISSDLEYLQPPPEPPTGRWRLFGQLHDLSDRLPSLEDHGIARLGPVIPSTSAEKDAHANKVFELKKLSKSLLLNFLELTGVLALNPNDAADKLADLQTIFYNMHQQVNEWRPHQTREALIALLQSQLEKTRNETRALQEVTDSTRRTLIDFATIQDPADSTRDPDALLKTGDRDESLQVSEKARYDEVWTALDEIFG